MSRPTFSMVPHWLLAMVAEDALPAQVVLTYIAIGKFARWSSGDAVAWPSQATLAAATGLSDRSVREHLRLLEDAGVIVRTPRSTSRGRSSDLISLAIERPATGSGLPVGTGSGLPGNENKVNENSSPSSPEVMVPPTEVASVVEAASQVVNQPSPQMTRRPFPVVYQRLLSDRHGVSTPEQREAWSSAWDRAEEIKGDVQFDPYDHLALYLTGCTERNYRASAVQWMRFFIQDRGEFITKMRVEMERAAREEETPQEREDRFNRRLPPVEWGIRHDADQQPQERGEQQ